VRDLEPATT
jgi:hypothetical protein